MRLKTRYRNTPPLGDFAALLRLANAVHLGAANPIARHRTMLDGLRELTRSSLAVSMLVAKRADALHVLTMIWTAHWPTQPLAALRLSEQAVNEVLRDGNAVRALLRGNADEINALRAPLLRLVSLAAPLRSELPTNAAVAAAVDVSSVILLFRERLAPPFDERDRRLVKLFHSQADWIYRPAPAMPVSRHRLRPVESFADPLPPESRNGHPETVDLSARQQQTLRQLLSGESEKQIALRMSISRHTVHEHVKAIYRAAKVSSRPELMARYLARVGARSDGSLMHLKETRDTVRDT